MISKTPFFFRILFLTLVLFANVQHGLSQEEEEDPIINFDPAKIEMSLLSLRLDAGIPNPVSSQLFRKKFIGVYEVSGCLNVKLSKSFSIGAGYENSLMSVSNRLRFGVKTKMQTHTGFGRISFNRFHRNTVFSTLFLNAGYSSLLFTDVVCLDNQVPKKNFNYYFLEPGYSLNFFAEENMTLGFFLTYTLTNFRFNPYSICLEDWTSLDGFNNQKNYSYLSFGLEMYWGFKKKR